MFGVEWNGDYYVDAALSFGLHSAPSIFTAVAVVLQWVMSSRGVTVVDHYLDDFITMGPPGSEIRGENLRRILMLCSELGVPLAMDQQEGLSHLLD